MRELKPSWLGRRTRWILAIILAVAALTRVGVALWLPAEPAFLDGHMYNRIAQHLVSERAYPTGERVLVPPHTLVLAVVYGLAGPSGTAARVVTAIFGTLTCWVVFLLGRGLWDSRVGLTAAGLVAVYPLYVFMNACYEYPQTLFILLCYSSIFLLVLAGKSDAAWWHSPVAGLAMGLAALTVPTVVTAVPLLVAWLLLRPHVGWRSRLGGAVAFAVMFSCTVGAWSGYQSYLHITVSGTGPETLFKGNCPLAWRLGKADIADRYETEGVPEEEREAYAQYVEVQRRAEACPAGPARDRIYYEAVTEYFTSHPGGALSLVARKLVLFWCPFVEIVTKHRADTGLTRAVQTIAFLPIVALALCGLVIFRTRWRDMLPLHILILSLWLTYSAFIVTTRYRSQIDGLLILIAAAALHACFDRVRGRFRGRTAPEGVSTRRVT